MRLLTAVGLLLAAGLAFSQGVPVDTAHPLASEVTIAVDPTNPQNLIASANLAFVYRSTDGGRTWLTRNVTSTLGVWGDPCLLFDDEGNALYTHLSYPQQGSWIDRIVVSRSTDHGESWSDGVGVGLNGDAQQDKQWLALDRTSSGFRGTIYMSWTEFDSYGLDIPTCHSRVRFARSTDRGLSWSDPITISDRDGDCIDSDSTDEGAVPCVDSTGAVWVIWRDKQGVLLDRSTDGGVTFGTDRLLAGTIEGWDFNVSGLQRCNGLPVLLCDASNGPHHGTMYAMWSDRIEPVGPLDVILARSTDNGTTWSSPSRVTSDQSGRDHFLPAMAVDQTTGEVHIVYYDRRYTHGDSTEVWMSSSTDGAVTFTDMPVDTAPFLPTTERFLGDYIGIAASRGLVYPIWTSQHFIRGREDSVRTSVHTSVVQPSTNGIRSTRPIELPMHRYLQPIHPNPVRTGTARIQVEYEPPVRERFDLALFDVAGRRLRTLSSESKSAGNRVSTINVSRLRAGAYLIRLQHGSIVEEQPFTIVR